MKTWLKLFPILAVVAALAVGWWLRPRASSSADPVYRTAEATRGDITQTVTASGSIEAVTTVQVGSQVSGNIVKLYVDYNDPVTENQLVAEIEPSTYQAKVTQAEADLQSAQATLELKQVTFRRNEELLARALISQSDYDTARAELRQQEATVRIKEASLQSARVDLEHTKIYSPIAGVVISREIDLGQTVQASFSAPELFKIAQDLRRMQISANVSEADIGGIAAGQAVTFTVDAFPGRTFDAKVKQVRYNSTTSNNVVTYTTIIAVDNSDLKLKPGMTANVVITTAHRAGVIRVPNAALRVRVPANARIRPPSGTPPSGEPPAPEPSAKMLYVLAAAAGTPASGELVPTPVQTGLADASFTEIVSGLAEKAVVVTGTTTAQASAASQGTATNPFGPPRPKSGSNSTPPPPPQ